MACIAALTLAGCTPANLQGPSGTAGGTPGAGSGGGTAHTGGTEHTTTPVGAFIGGTIGSTMDESDRRRAQQAIEYNRTAQPATWRNARSGSEYTLTPTRSFAARGGEACRDYTTGAVIGGRRESLKGTACRMTDGRWQAAD